MPLVAAFTREGSTPADTAEANIASAVVLLSTNNGCMDIGPKLLAMRPMGNKSMQWTLKPTMSSSASRRSQFLAIVISIPGVVQMLGKST